LDDTTVTTRQAIESMSAEVYAAARAEAERSVRRLLRKVLIRAKDGSRPTIDWGAVRRRWFRSDARPIPV